MAITLDSLRRGKRKTPPRIIVYGTNGIGKSTFASQAPNPFFIDVEDGIRHLDTTSYPANSFDEIGEVLQFVHQEEHDFQTLVIDTLDWVERRVHEAIQDEHGKTIMTDYGKGYTYAVDYFNKLLKKLNLIVNERNMGIILLAHCQSKMFESPLTEPYRRYQLDLHDKVGSLCEEWADAVLFANYKTFIAKTDVGFGKEAKRGIGSGERLLYTEERPGHKAKNRYDLAPEMALSWEAFAEGYAKHISGAVADTPEKEVKPKRKRRTKAEIEAAKQEQQEQESSEAQEAPAGKTNLEALAG